MIEYVGEIIDDETVEKRMIEYNNETNFYFLTIGNNQTIDASRYANWGRFVNHSCDPNCETQKWFVMALPFPFSSSES